jgi:hypothetical protein
MSGLDVRAVILAAAILALVVWIWRRYGFPSRQMEIVLFFSGLMVWIGMAIALYSLCQAPVRHSASKSRKPALATGPSDNRTLLDLEMSQATGPQPSPPALAYAAPESGVLDNRAKITFGPLLGLDEWTAVYDISAHTVYLPDGTELEAHSGRGARLDDPRYVHEPMRGATPPHIYELALRELPFHGVQALRLKPIGGGKVLGRTGLLAHTYMLGPKGESNGCVVFKNYEAFLQAFQNGGVKRLIVVDRLD